MTNEEHKLLADIRSKCADPVWVDHVIHAAVEGMVMYAKRQRAFAVDMETVAALALNARLFKKNEKFIADKLQMNHDACSLDWSEQIERLRK